MVFCPTVIVLRSSENRYLLVTEALLFLHISIRNPSSVETILYQVMFLQDMPTKEWGEEEVEPLLSQAYILSTLFEGSPNHLGA